MKPKVLAKVFLDWNAFHDRERAATRATIEWRSLALGLKIERLRTWREREKNVGKALGLNKNGVCERMNDHRVTWGRIKKTMLNSKTTNKDEQSVGDTDTDTTWDTTATKKTDFDCCRQLNHDSNWIECKLNQNQVKHWPGEKQEMWKNKIKLPRTRNCRESQCIWCRTTFWLVITSTPNRVESNEKAQVEQNSNFGCWVKKRWEAKKLEKNAHKLKKKNDEEPTNAREKLKLVEHDERRRVKVWK